MSKKALFAAALVALVGGFASQATDAGVDNCARLDRATVKEICEAVTAAHFPAVDPLMLRAMVEIESSRDPCAFRPELHLDDASIGLMQTLLQTALWLYRDMGAKAMGEPDLTKLRDPATSVYFGAAYVNWLRTFRNTPQTEEFIVRGYNGGPGGVHIPQTAHHLRKYVKAKADLIDFDAAA